MFDCSKDISRTWLQLFEAILALHYRKRVLNDGVTHRITL